MITKFGVDRALTAAEKAREGKMKKEFLKGLTMLSGHGRILP
jgi:hypothetical protein